MHSDAASPFYVVIKYFLPSHILPLPVIGIK